MENFTMSTMTYSTNSIFGNTTDQSNSNLNHKDHMHCRVAVYLRSTDCIFVSLGDHCHIPLNIVIICVFCMGYIVGKAFERAELARRRRNR